jgi:hypothetical protein
MREVAMLTNRKAHEIIHRGIVSMRRAFPLSSRHLSKRQRLTQTGKPCKGLTLQTHCYATTWYPRSVNAKLLSIVGLCEASVTTASWRYEENVLLQRSL